MVGSHGACRLLLGTILACFSPRHEEASSPTNGVIDNLEGIGNLLTEDPAFFEAEAVGYQAAYRLRDGREVSLALAPRHSLWGHLVWNAGRAAARYIEEHPSTVQGKRVLELGAGSGLPSIVCALHGSALVCATDYPDDALLDALRRNVVRNGVSDVVHVAGFKWGGDYGPLLEHGGGQRFDLVLLCDVIFNHMAHRALLTSCRGVVAEGGKVLVMFSHHRASKVAQDLDLFRMAREEFDFRVELLGEERMEAMEIPHRENGGLRHGDEAGGEASKVVWIYEMSGGGVV